jgi:hypothetical protein
MNVVSLILFILAAVLFTVAGLVPPYFGRLVSLGLAVATVGFIVEFGARSQTIHFG